MLELARIYISDTKFSASARELLKALQTRFKRDDDTLIEQIHDKYEELKEKAPTKDKIELWIAQWENLRNEIITESARIECARVGNRSTADSGQQQAL